MDNFMGLVLVDNNYLDQAILLIQNAKDEICISSFKLECSDLPRGRRVKKFYDVLIERLKSGVKVRLLMNWHSNRRSVPKTNEPAGRKLQSHGGDVRFLKNNRCCHAKILVVDREKALIGSHNLSIRSCESNFELSYLIPDPESVAQISQVFESSFSDAQRLGS